MSGLSLLPSELGLEVTRLYFGAIDSVEETRGQKESRASGWPMIKVALPLRLTGHRLPNATVQFRRPVGLAVYSR